MCNPHNIVSTVGYFKSFVKVTHFGDAFILSVNVAVLRISKTCFIYFTYSYSKCELRPIPEAVNLFYYYYVYLREG